MQFTSGLVAVAALFSQALAIPILTNSNYNLQEGQAFDITWTNATGAVTLALKTGVSTDLTTYTDIAAGLSGDSYSWTPSNIPSGTYAISITDSTGDTNYSPQFTYQGTGTATTSGTSSTSASATTGTSTGTASATTTDTSTASNTAAVTSGSSTANGTSTSSSTKSSSTKSSTSTSSSGSTSTPVNTNDSQKMGSPLALVLLTAAALTIFH